MFGAKQITYQLMSCHPKGISCLQHLASTGGSIFIANLATVAIAAHVMSLPVLHLLFLSNQCHCQWSCQTHHFLFSRLFSPGKTLIGLILRTAQLWKLELNRLYCRFNQRNYKMLKNSFYLDEYVMGNRCNSLWNSACTQNICCHVILQPLDGAARQCVAWDLNQTDAQREREVSRQTEGCTDRKALQIYSCFLHICGHFSVYFCVYFNSNAVS